MRIFPSPDLPNEISKSSDNYKEYLSRLKEYIFSEKEKIRLRHLQGAGGEQIVKENTALIDKIIRSVFSKSLQEYEEKNGPAKPDCALLAIGGYGRGELNPYSDIDILFLHTHKIEPAVDWLLGRMVSLLWDAGFELGHSVRTIENCLAIARRDIIARTAMMESRLIIGDEFIFTKFHNTYQREIIKKSIKDFIEEKITERKKRYEIYNHTVCISEPNIKESPGGLRDFQTAMWIAHARFEIRTLPDLCQRGLIDQEELQQIRASSDFLLRIRNELHFQAKKKNDILGYPEQNKIHTFFGYENVIPFMAEYFRNARNILNFSNHLIKRAEGYKQGLRAFLITTKFKNLPEGFSAFEKEIHIKGFKPEVFVSDQLLLLKTFFYCQEYDLTLSNSIKKQIELAAKFIEPNLLNQPEIKSILKKIISGKNLSFVLRMWHDLGILNRLIPEFIPITFRIHNDFYHRYTVDEHSFKTLEFLEELETTNQYETMNLKKIYKNIASPGTIKLAAFLHDIGKGINKEGHSRTGAEIAFEIILRLGLEEKTAVEVKFLVRHHLLMNHIAQRRDMHDRKTIADFVLQIGNDPERLKMLYLLTYADIRAVASIWSAWKGALLWELYCRTTDFLSSRTESISDTAIINRIKEKITTEIKNEFEKEIIHEYFNLLPEKYFLATPEKMIVNHIKLYNNLKIKKLVTGFSHNLDIGYSELIICTEDRPGIFSKIAGTLTSKNINILGAQIYTNNAGIIIDTLQVTTVDHKPLLDEEMWGRIERDLLAVIEGKINIHDLINSRKKYSLPGEDYKMTIPTKIEINNNLSDSHTIIEISICDQLGILYRMTDSLFEMGLNIYLAKISTQAHKGINVFYVTDLEGRKIIGETEINQLKSELLQKLQFNTY